MRGLEFKESEDSACSENFVKIREGLDRNVMAGFEGRIVSSIVGSAKTGVRVRHGLGFVPRDVVVTSVVGSASVTFRHEQFDHSDVVFDCTGPVAVRFLVGTFRS